MKPCPKIGDIVELKAPAHRSQPKQGIVLRVRVHKDGMWTAAELLVDGVRSWYGRGEVSRILGRPPGISRIDQPTRRTHGWFVRLYYKGKNPRYARLFSDQKHNGIEQSLQAALAFYSAAQLATPSNE